MYSEKEILCVRERECVCVCECVYTESVYILRGRYVCEREKENEIRITHRLYSSVLRKSNSILTLPALTFSAREGTSGLSPSLQLRCSPYTLSRPTGHGVSLTYRSRLLYRCVRANQVPQVGP